MIRFTTIIAVCWVATLAIAQDQPPPSAGPSIIAPKEVTGTGKRSDPFIFTPQTKCMLRLTGDASGEFQWDTEDAPKDIEAIDKTLIFSLSEVGTFQVIAHGEKTYARCWFQVKSGADPPAPPNLEDSLGKRVKAALVGPDAKADAGKLAGMVDAAADALGRGEYPTMKELNEAWKRGQMAAAWPAGKYPDMPAITRDAIPPVDDSTVIDAAKRSQFVKNLRAISKAALEVHNG